MSKFSGTFSPVLQPYNLHLASSLPFKSLTNVAQTTTTTTTAARDSSEHTHRVSLVIENHTIQFSRIIVSTNDFTKKSSHVAGGGWHHLFISIPIPWPETPTSPGSVKIGKARCKSRLQHPFRSHAASVEPLVSHGFDWTSKHNVGEKRSRVLKRIIPLP